MPYPKVVALDIEWTLIKSWMDYDKLGKGPNAYFPPEDNLELVEDGWQLRDRSNHGEYYWIYGDVPGIISDILKNGAKITLVSQNKSRALMDRVFWWFKTWDPKTKKNRPIIELVKFVEVYPGDKTEHMKKIQGYTGYDYADMILFDDQAPNNLVRVVQGVTFQVSRDSGGLSWSNYNTGIDLWRRINKMRSPYLGQNPDLYPRKMHIGYSGVDEATAALLTSGKNRVDLKESARWGYATYVTDNPGIARYFAEWIKADAFGQNTRTLVCEIWIRDWDIFKNINKLWVPDRSDLQTNVKSGDAFAIGWSQEDRDRQALQWGVQTPYILFSKHPRMEQSGPFFASGPRWNEMVIYSQLQEAMLLAFPMSPAQLNAKISQQFWQYHQKVSA